MAAEERSIARALTAGYRPVRCPDCGEYWLHVLPGAIAANGVSYKCRNARWHREHGDGSDRRYLVTATGYDIVVTKAS